MISISAIVISLLVALLLGGLIGTLLEAGFGTVAGLIVGTNVWFWGWTIAIALHFISKYW